MTYSLSVTLECAVKDFFEQYFDKSLGLSADFDMSQYQHPNRLAPRCLPCNYTDPAEGPPSNKTYVGFRAPRVRSQTILHALVW